MNNYVLVTSAIYTKHGIYSAEERIDQTANTFDSVRKYIPNSKIILIDNSRIQSNKNIDALLSKIDYFIDNSEDSDIKYFHDSINDYDMAKNGMECIGMKSALMGIYNNPSLYNEILDGNRVFKISGRYEVSENFNIKNHSHRNKFVFKKRNSSWINHEWTGVDSEISTRLWSFCPSLFCETILIFDKILSNMILTFNKNQYIDIEHSMAKFIPISRLMEVDVVGVKGNLAPNGAYVSE